MVCQLSKPSEPGGFALNDVTKAYFKVCSWFTVVSSLPFVCYRRFKGRRQSRKPNQDPHQRLPSFCMRTAHKFRDFTFFSPVVEHMGWFSNCVGAGSTTDEEQRLRGELSRLRSENRSLRERLGESSSASPREYGDAASSIIRGGDRRPSVDKERREEIEKERRLSLGEVPIILRADHVVQGATLLGVIWASALSRPSPSASCQTRLTALCCCALFYCCAHTSPLKPCQVPAKRVPCATSLLRRRAAPGRGLRSLRQGLQRRHQRAGATPGARVPWRGGFVRGGRVHHEAI